jgi:hypothetical protein
MSKSTSTRRIIVAVMIFTGVVPAAGLVFVFGPILGWFGHPPEGGSFYITEVGVPLLTFAGFLAVFLGFLSQWEQNDLQRRQLNNQRRQLDNQRRQLNKQQENFQKERFEQTFFQLLRTHNEIVNDISCPSRIPVEYGDYGREPTKWNVLSTQGRMCLESFYSGFEEKFRELAEENDWNGIQCKEEGKVSFAYEQWFSEKKSQLDHYFNTLSQSIIFVHTSDVDNKQFYVNLIVSQMSSAELKLFYYHTVCKRNQSNFDYVGDVYELLAEYQFFGQLEKNSLAHENHYHLNKPALGIG